MLYLCNCMKKEKPIFDKRIFWDVDVEKIDYDGNAASVIERVFDRGDVDDIIAARRYYGDKKVIEALTNAKFLFDETINFCSVIFQIPKDKFRCYILKQSNPVHSGF
jgi:hypothetical protein